MAKSQLGVVVSVCNHNARDVEPEGLQSKTLSPIGKQEKRKERKEGGREGGREGRKERRKGKAGQNKAEREGRER